MAKTRFNFGSIVIVEDYFIGVVVKSWQSSKTGFNYDIYVRSFNCIKNYQEEEITWLEYDKEISYGQDTD